MNESLKQRVMQVVTEHITPVLDMDDSSIEVIDVSDGIAQLRFHGTCSSCPGTVWLLISEIEQLLRNHVPEVQFVEAVG